MNQNRGKPIVVTDRGNPVLTVAPYRPAPPDALKALRETVVKYEAPTKPVAEDDWESGR